MIVQAKFISFMDSENEIMEVRKSAFGISEKIDEVDISIESTHVLIYAGDVESRHVATGRLYRIQGETIIDKVGVIKEEQRKKYGELAVRMLVDKAFRNGENEVFVYTDKENIGFFQQIGFGICSILENGIQKLVINKNEFYEKTCN